MQKSTLEDELENEFPNKTIEIADSANKKEWIVTIDGVTENVPIGKDTSELKVAEHKNRKFSTNTELEDDFGNKITVPAGFKITIDSPSSVTKGIVIEDVDAGTTETVGSQFVWIPVGDIYIDPNKTKTNIELCRCGFNENGEKVTVEEGWEYQITYMKETGMPESYASQFRAITFTEENETRNGSASENKNATANDLNDFRTKASKKGYYIGRYEARTTSARTESGDATTVVTEKVGDPVYNYVTQLQASERSKKMYTSEEFESDLINSYAWDTAILFLQAFDDRSDKSTKYSLLTSLNQSTLETTGTTTDKICNIYDMASNCAEWTTETSDSSGLPCVYRGGSYFENFSYTSFRYNFSGYGHVNTCRDSISFRPILYVK